jgi:DUF4097 and DUF4098 domain-containing protein YvlB
MIKKYFIVGFIVVFLVGGFSGCLEPKATDYFSGEYEADVNTVLKVSTINGQIEIYSWDGDVVSLNAVKKSTISQEELDYVEINVIESEDLIEIEAKYVGKRLTTPSVDMNIKVPENVTVDFVTTSNGGMQISGAKGDIIATTSNGAIIIENVDGYVSASTSNGRIELKGTTGVKDLKTSNGDISAEVYDFQENISLITSNGGINVYLNSSLDADVEMTTSNGHISIIDLSLDLTISEDKYKVGVLGEGGYILDVHTSNGNINLYKLDT